MARKAKLTTVLDRCLGSCIDDGVVDRSKLREQAAKAFGDAGLPDNADEILDRYIEQLAAWDAAHEANAEDEPDDGNPPKPAHLVDRATVRIRPFDVLPELAHLVCDECGGKPPRDSFIVHVDTERNEKQEMKSLMFLACSRDHADNLASGAVVEKALQITVEG